MTFTLQPPNLGGGSVTFVISRGYSEDNSRFRGGIHMGRAERFVGHGTGVGRAAVDADERRLRGRCRRHLAGVLRNGTGASHDQVDGILENRSGIAGRRLPGELSAVGGFQDFYSTRSTGESRKTCFES